MPESHEARELLARAAMHEKLAEATEDERARRMELALAAELRRKAAELDQAPDTPLHRIRAELQDKLDREQQRKRPKDERGLQELRETIGELNRVIDGAPRS